MSRIHRYLAPASAYVCTSAPLDPLYVLGACEPSCPVCEEGMVVHQPDPGLPERLLATCDGCKAWGLIDRDGGLMLILPEGPNDGA